MAHHSPSEEPFNDQSNNTALSVDQQYKNWDIVKATQVALIVYSLSVRINFRLFLCNQLSTEYLTVVKK